MLCKSIETLRLSLVPFSEKYLTGRYVAWLNDPETVKYSENRHKTHTLETCRQYTENFKDSPSYIWAITLKDTGEHVGNINAHVNSVNSIADVGIIIGEKEYWGQGYASEAWNGVIDFILNDARIRKVTAGTMSENEGMLKIMRKSGMVDDGVRKRHYLLDGTEVDIIHMAIFNKDN